MASLLSNLVSQSKSLTSHLARPDLPSVNLDLDQIEAQSRRLIPRQPGTAADQGRANYLLAQAHVDAPALTNTIHHLNTTTTFSPLQPLQDTDVAGYLRHAHEQNIISTIEEGRKETQQEFYRLLEERGRKDWEARKKRVFEELGGRANGESRALSDSKKSTTFKGFSASVSVPSPSLQMQSKMMAYDRVVSQMNAARLRGTSFPIVHELMNASQSINPDRMQQLTQNFHLLTKITAEPPSLPPLAHAGAHMLNTPLFERKYARAYLGDPESREAVALRRQIVAGSREHLEEQYWDVLDRTLQAKAAEARLGGDPSVANKVKSFTFIRHWSNGDWDNRIELLSGQALWAKLFYMVRTGHAREAVDEALKMQQAIENREQGFVSHFRAWVEAPDGKLARPHRDHLQTLYNAHMLHSQTADPFKLALYKLMGKLEPTRRSVPLVTATTEDWLWFQLAMIDEEEQGGLRGLAEAFLSYGERQFDGAPGQSGSRRGLWAGVLLMCGQFERAVAALSEHQETEIEAIHLGIALAYHGLLRVPPRAESSDMTPLCLSPTSPPALNLSAMIWRYVRQFVKMDAKEALHYVYCGCLCADQPGPAGKEQVEIAWDLVRRIIVMANAGAGWEELVGGFRPDGTRFSGVIEQGASLLKLKNTQEFKEQILVTAAKSSEQTDRIPEAIKLYNLAGDYETVVACLAGALGTTIGLPDAGGDKGRGVEKTAAEVLQHYERTNRAVGKERDAVVRLLRIREAMDAKDAGRVEVALEILESTDLIPLDGDMAKIARRADELKDLHEALQRNLQTYLTLTMDAIAAMHTRLRGNTKAVQTLTGLRRKSRSLMVFAGMLKYRMSPDVYSYLARLDVEIAL